MISENSFLMYQAPTKKNIAKAEIERDNKYFKRKTKRQNIMSNVLDKTFKIEKLKKYIEKLVSWRQDKQEHLREEHKKSPADLEADYARRYALIMDGDYESTMERKNLHEEMAREIAYYELNPNGEWTETDGETQEREFARGVIMQKELEPLGLCDVQIEEASLDADKNDLAVSYKNEVETLSSFDKESAQKCINILFELQSKVNSEEILTKMKSAFGCQENIYIVEDIFDSFEGFKDDTTAVFKDWEDTSVSREFKQSILAFIDVHKDVFSRYQKWNRNYLVNNNLKIDNLSISSLPIDWSRVGVTNNFLCALINDYGQLRQTAEEKGHEEFVRALDENIIQKFQELNDEEAGKAVVKLTILRTSVINALSKESDLGDMQEEIKNLHKS